jgi:hypothetical protein
LLASFGVVQWLYSGCVFVPGMQHVPDKVAKAGIGYQCAVFMEWARTRLEMLTAEIPVVIIGRYGQAAMGLNEGHLTGGVPEVCFSKIYPTTTSEFLDEFSLHITRSACDLVKRRTVYMMRPIPEMGFDVPKTLSRRMAWSMTGDVSISMEDYRKRNAWVWAARDAALDQCGIKILDPIPYLCQDGRCYGSIGWSAVVL